MSTICILGRQPQIGLAELESLYGSSNVQQIGQQAALVSADIAFTRLGGSVKAAEYITTLETSSAQKAFDACRKALPELIADLPEGKIKLGASLYGMDMPVHKINANVLSLKKVIRTLNRSVRAVPNTEPALSSAQTYHNQLASAVGLELIMVRDGSSILIGHLKHVQNINEYAERDQQRPKRDTKVGMLPPKLAQTIINLASGELTPTSQDSGSRLLDPFCGTGVVLQEAALMGHSIYGTDIEERMVRYTRDNLNWLFETRKINVDHNYEVADATDHTWQQPIDIVACEAYLGIPFANEPLEEPLRDTIATCNVILKKFLKNIHPQLQSGTRLCIAVPAWFVRGRVHHVPFLETLSESGYRRHEFLHVPSSQLVYHREDQIVGRELVVLIKD